MTKPVWFLDIDGVLNVIPSASKRNSDTAPHFKVWKNWHPVTDVTVPNKVGFATYPIRVSPDLIDNVNAISENVDIHWLTTWKNLAPTIFAPTFGVKDFPVADAYGSESPFGSRYAYGNLPEFRWWKLNAVIKDMEVNARPVIWTDDDISSSTSGSYVKSIARDLDIPILVIPPFDAKGIEPWHIDRIKEFVAENS